VRTLLVLLVSLAVIGLVEGALQGARFLAERRRGALRRRLESLGRPRPVDPILLRQGRYSASPALDAWLAAQPWAARVADLLEQAASRRTVAQVLAASLAGAGAGALAAPFVGAGAAALVAAAAAAAPLAALVVARERRSRAISEQLPEALDMMARSLRAGHALGSAFRLVASEMPEPISVEFSRAHEEQQLGLSLARTVRDMAARSPRNGDLKIFAVSTVIQAETGGNLAEILDGIARTVRERFQFYGKVRALTAEARISGAFVSAMPFVLAVLLALVQPGYLARLADNQLGRAILAGGLAFWGVGVVWFLRLTRVGF
jgi:tight adherence protein B